MDDRNNLKSLVDERLTRIKKAVALERPDRVPVVLEYGAFAAHVTNTPLPDFLLNVEKSVEVMMEAYRLIAEVAEADAVNYGRFSPYDLSYLWMSKVKVPGVDLPDDVSYQVVEKEAMTVDDYDTILERGWRDFYKEYIRNRIFDDVPRQYLPANQPKVDALKAWARMDVPVLQAGTVAPPFEFLCGARSMEPFFMDLFDMPDKVQAVMDSMAPGMAAPVCKRARSLGYPCVWVGGWRGNPAMISPEMWDRFFWPYFRDLVVDVVENGLIPILHLDAGWDRELNRFRELPKGRIIMALDGFTDIFRAKEILGDHMCSVRLRHSRKRQTGECSGHGGRRF
ncbi:MAG: uroporphyrinogen decarboxylase [Deltaproteobacteria bacterium]|nr:uroporphyrinogen decarboxylase [Deltaproteobacteria bacterium]